MQPSFFAPLLTVAVGLLAGQAGAVPTPAQLVPRCGTTYYPSILQQLVEAAPDTVGTNTAPVAGGNGAFAVRQAVSGSGVVSDRVYQLVAFDGIAPGAYGCQLAITFPAGYPIDAWVGAPGDGAAPQLNVTTVLRSNPAAIAYPNAFSFDAFPGLLAPGAGLFGTVSAVAGTTAVVNSESCDSRLAFLFSVASWTGQSAGTAFTEQKSPLAGVYLTANC